MVAVEVSSSVRANHNRSLVLVRGTAFSRPDAYDLLGRHF